MIDEFGAVYVMDCGLAKRLPTEEHPFVDSPTQVELLVTVAAGGRSGSPLGLWRGQGDHFPPGTGPAVLEAVCPIVGIERRRRQRKDAAGVEPTPRA
jgi:hypothetical protein